MSCSEDWDVRQGHTSPCCVSAASKERETSGGREFGEETLGGGPGRKSGTQYSRAALARTETETDKYLHWLAYGSKTRVLDAGCGDGSVVMRLRERGYRATGFDLRWWAWPGGPDWVVCVGTRLPFRDESFDAVGCLAVLEHLEDPIPFLEELVRVLKPAGRIVVAAPNMYGSILLAPGHSVTHTGGRIRHAKNFALHLRKSWESLATPGRITFDPLHPDLTQIPKGATDYDAICATDPAVLRAVLRRNGVRIVHSSPSLEHPGSAVRAAVVKALESFPFLRDLFGGIFVVGRKSVRR